MGELVASRTLAQIPPSRPPSPAKAIASPGHAHDHSATEDDLDSGRSVHKKPVLRAPSPARYLRGQGASSPHAENDERPTLLRKIQEKQLPISEILKARGSQSPRSDLAYL